MMKKKCKKNEEDDEEEEGEENHSDEECTIPITFQEICEIFLYKRIYILFYCHSINTIS